jgi:predicted dehydrogenase
VNWLAPVKVRTTMLGGSKKMLVYNDVEPSEKVKVYDRGITVNANPENLYQQMIAYRAGDVWAPQLPNSEALSAEIQHLVDCIEHGKEPMTGGEAGMEVVRILECGTRSMRGQGLPVELASQRSVAI